MLTVQDSEHKGLPAVGGNERGHGGCRHEPCVRKAGRPIALRRLTSQLLGVLSRVSSWLAICGIIFTCYILSGIIICVRGSEVSHAKFKLSGLKRSMANCVAIMWKVHAPGK